MVALKVNTEIRTLGGSGVMCDVKDCGRPAGFLFKTLNGPISAYCELHAAQSADRHGLELPDLPQKVLRAAW